MTVAKKAPTFVLALWKTLPSWYLLAEQDRMINPSRLDTVRLIDVSKGASRESN